MLIKKYTVNNMNEALTRIRYELGKDAVIISQRKVKKPGIKGVFLKRQLEVTAAVENSSIDRKSSKAKSSSSLDMNNTYERKKALTDYNMNKSINDLKELMNKEIEKKRNNAVINENSSINTKEAQIESEVKEMKDMLKAVMKNTTKDTKKDELL